MVGIVSFLQMIVKSINRPNLTLGDIQIYKTKQFWTVYVAIYQSK